MKWWGRKAGAAPRPALLRGLGLGSWTASAEAGWPRSYEAQVRDAFLGNPVAQRAVRLVAEAVASVTIYAESGETDARASAPPPGITRSPSPSPAATGRMKATPSSLCPQGMGRGTAQRVVEGRRAQRAQPQRPRRRRRSARTATVHAPLGDRHCPAQPPSVLRCAAPPLHRAARGPPPHRLRRQGG